MYANGATPADAAVGAVSGTNWDGRTLLGARDLAPHGKHTHTHARSSRITSFTYSGVTFLLEEGR